MRLINVRTYAIQEFFGDSIPAYAILSHTWGEEEVTFQDMQHLNEEVKAKLGFEKIKNTCEQAQRDLIDWSWVDTCCIDKTSSAELSEAINSMFQWYARSKICYAFLADVRFVYGMSKSRWFTRGWTLQEMLAPSEVVFYSKDWEFLGRKAAVGTGFQLALLEACGISQQHIRVLTSFAPEDWTIGEKMSWASARQTTRVEDVAYCLLGLFGANMPPLYGEGERAFIRLQEEIMRVSDDQSLFAWADKDAIPGLPSGILARHPANFAESSVAIGDSMRNRYDETATPHRLSNRGVHIQLTLVPIRSEPTTFYALLGNTPSDFLIRRPAIIVRHIVGRSFFRIQPETLVTAADMYSILPQYWYMRQSPRKLILRQIAPPLKYLNAVEEETATLLVDYSQLVASNARAKLIRAPNGARVAHSSVICPNLEEGERRVLEFEWLDTVFNLHIFDGSYNMVTKLKRFERLHPSIYSTGTNEIVLCEYTYTRRLVRADSSFKSLGEGKHLHCIALYSLETTKYFECFIWLVVQSVGPGCLIWVSTIQNPETISDRSTLTALLVFIHVTLAHFVGTSVGGGILLVVIYLTYQGAWKWSFF